MDEKHNGQDSIDEVQQMLNTVENPHDGLGNDTSIKSYMKNFSNHMAPEKKDT